MKIYIDDEFKCHASDDGTMTVVETDFFDSKCAEYVEGYRYDPVNEMLTPWKNWSELDNAQRNHEQALIVDMQNALNKLGVSVNA